MTATLAPRPCTHARRDAIAAACDELPAMTDVELTATRDRGDSVRVAIAAALVLAGRRVATPPHPTGAEFVAAVIFGGS